MHGKAGCDMGGEHTENEGFEAGADSELQGDNGVSERLGGILAPLHGGRIIRAKILRRLSSRCERRCKWMT